MRRMFSKKQIEKMVEENPQLVIEALKGQDLSLANLSISENLAVHEEAKVFEAMTDENDHKRFIEGDITFATITGITQTYGKWSLSGTHLMIVVGGEIDNGTTITAQTLAPLPNLPQWIVDKIRTLFGYNVIRDSMYLWGDDYSTQTCAIILLKQDDAVRVQIGNITTTAKRNFRFVFDLLIDNASED